MSHIISHGTPKLNDNSQHNHRQLSCDNTDYQLKVHIHLQQEPMQVVIAKSIHTLPRLPRRKHDKIIKWNITQLII